jgi:hypothetical protein
MPPRIAVTTVMSVAKRRTAAAVRTGKLDIPERMKMPLSLACWS